MNIGFSRFGLLVAIQFLVALPALGQATRTWVSGVGDDANPCSRTAPCKTFAGAISKTAENGEISVLDPGGYGAINITKSITLNGAGTLAGILNAGTNGIIVNAGVTDIVVIRNVSIDGGGTGVNGIRFIAGGELHVENSTIQGNAGHGILFQPAATSYLFVANTSIRNNAGGGIHLQPLGSVGVGNVVLDRVIVAGNLRGIRAEDGTNLTMSNSSVIGSDFNGVVSAAVSRPVTVALENCVIANSGNTGIWSGANSVVRMYGTLVTRNATGLFSVDGGQIATFGHNRVFGNTTTDGTPTSGFPSI